MSESKFSLMQIQSILMESTQICITSAIQPYKNIIILAECSTFTFERDSKNITNILKKPLPPPQHRVSRQQHPDRRVSVFPGGGEEQHLLQVRQLVISPTPNPLSPAPTPLPPRGPVRSLSTSAPGLIQHSWFPGGGPGAGGTLT